MNFKYWKFELKYSWNIQKFITESSIENSAGSSAPGVILADNKFIKVLSRSRFRPDTLDTWKIGHNLNKLNESNDF
jgi:hypothetical protein